MKVSKFYVMFLIVALALSITTPASALGTITIKPSALNGWGILPNGNVAATTGNATGKIVAGPGGQPDGLLPGSVEYKTNSLPGGKPQLYAPATLIGTKFNELTALSYSTYISQYASGSPWLVHAINIKIDLDGDLVGTTTDRYTMVFEPCYTTSCSSAIQPLNAWATWDALAPEAIWWSTGSIPGTAFTVPFGSYAPLTSIYATYSDAAIYFILFQAGQGSGGAPWNDFVGYLDGITIGILGNNTTYDFEPEPSCTTVCYADAINGNDANGGASMANAKKTIQAALDAVSPNGTVRVLPGNYSETAANRFVLGVNGPHQFGLFIDKDGVTIQGVNAGDVAITDYHALGAYITTNATNNFGASGIFVQGDNVTIAGLKIGPNIPGDNKTLEIIGDGFTLKDSHVDVPDGGSIYFDDWRFDTINNVSHVQSYTIDHNLIDQSTSIDITSGTGFSGDFNTRSITNNEFENSEYWPSISFNGSGTGVPWFVQSVGGAVIENNSFTNTFNGTNPTAGHIRVRGFVDESQFDWNSYWVNNTFNKAVVILDAAPFSVREYNYTSGTYSFDVRRIGVNIQGSIDKAVAGDTVLVRDGTYNESPHINKSLTLKSWNGRDVTTIQLQTVPTYLGALTIDAADVTVYGFTIFGFDGTPSTLASTNIYVTSTPDYVEIINNRVKVGAIDLLSSNGDDGFGLITTYNVTNDVDNLTVSGNIFEPLNSAGARAFYINPGVNHFLFFQNVINGNFTRTAITQAKDGIVEENILTGVGATGSRSRGFGTWGYPDPTIYGHTTFRNNTITGVSKGVAVSETNNVTIENNFFIDNDIAVWIGDSAPLAFNPATISINENSLVNSDMFGTQNASGSTGTANAEMNWWGNNSSVDVAAEVNGNVDFTPWLCSGVDTSPAPGFQPSLVTGCYQFNGFFQPIDTTAVNIAKAGQTVPVKWQLLDVLGLPISDLTSFAKLVSYPVACSSYMGNPADAIEEYTSGTSGLQYNGDGYWQFNWKTPKTYIGTCRKMYIQFEGGFKSPEVIFQFK